MNRLFFVLVSSVALMFAACGDSGNGASPHSNADMDVQTYSELPSCAEKRDGKTAYVADKEQGYICQNGKWVEDDDVKVVDYPSSSTSLTGNLLTDSRDGQSYRIVTIGSQTWMAQNLNYETADSYCYSDTPSNCTKYGRLYTWAAAKTACPTGWHLPSSFEWDALFRTVGGSITAGKMLKSTSGWNSGGNSVSGTDNYSFSALPAGFRSYGEDYYDEGYYADFWSSTEIDSYDAYGMYLLYGFDNAYLYYDSKYNGFSVRCVKDGSTNKIVASSSSVVKASSSSVVQNEVVPSTVAIGSLTDSRDGKKYKTVTIGSQTWMAQNLNYETANSYCYGNTPSNCTKYGRLYTWAAAKTACPTGWHLPTKAEFETLFTAVGGSSTAGTKLKSTSGWNDCNGKNGNGTDDYSFSALPAGYRGFSEGYDEGYYAFFWSSSEDDSGYAYYMYLDYSNDDAYLYLYYKRYGFSVRCVKD